jgi:hypothetical protein
VVRVKARGRDLITVLGHAAMIAAGEFVQARGSWINDRTHGVQLRASFLGAKIDGRRNNRSLGRPECATRRRFGAS